LTSRPKISVCLAAYQGERYIASQLQSILEQLSAGDEVIVVDDGSSDGTCGEVSAAQDGRVILIKNAENQGVLRAFETALAQSSGEIVFLSDQDDLWLPKKVERVLDAFVSSPDVMLVVSDAILIDEGGTTIGQSFYAKRGKFRAGLWSNVLIGKFHGCTMAFRSVLLRRALPFPRGRLVHHDTWIGCMNALMRGKTKYIAEPLVAYRRHSTNVTGRVKLSNYTRFKTRLQLLLGLLSASWTRRRSGKIWQAGTSSAGNSASGSGRLVSSSPDKHALVAGKNDGHD
jgi:glycosyltransferase involved in cell wall biosynthesis